MTSRSPLSKVRYLALSIGHNGADKSNIFKLLAKTPKQTSGTIKLKVTPHVVVSCRLARTKYSELVDSAEYIRRSSMNYRDRITIEPGKRGGKPCIRGIRMTVYDILDYLASGMMPSSGACLNTLRKR
ncbi:DUF433 domain-containing protein [Candidatus Nitrotoga sp. 1052]|uniref:DUF433 domain-containing protein n=1 Tax=Candidatus Nitrotoga sp. 1052 TaxID=2886964 RepID=UPI001EF54781|nr:DUF433 domain-containing protein [Candidatus Nitrotoga sp. 1052]CAH1087270.1 hypothetical protein NTG1052_60044 [Candidatus Nitrotoga sp. 1052]